MSTRRSARRHLVTVSVTVAAAAVDGLFFLGTKYPHTLRVGPGELPAWAGALVVLAAAAVLLVRRRFPVRVLAVLWVVACAALLVREWLFLACLTVALYAVAAETSRRVATAALVACALPLVVQASLTSPGSLDPLGETLVRLGFFALVLGVAWGLGRHHRAVAQRHRATVELQAQESARALQQERLRLSRELHDIVSHTVSVMTLQAAGARTLVGRDDRRVVAALEVVEQAGVQAMNELGRLLSVMRTEDRGEEDPLLAQPRLEDLPTLVEQARAGGQDVELDLVGEPGRLDPSVALAGYRIVQEALTNARKYAGRALIRVHLSWVPPRLVLTVSNDAGPGPDGEDVAAAPALSTGHGLRGLAERVDLVGGVLESGPTPDGGYRVRATLPVAAVGSPRAPERPAPGPGGGSGPADAWGSFD